MRKVLYLTAFGSVAAIAAAVSLMPWEPTSTAPKEPIRIPVVEYDPSWKCPTCTPEEKYVLEQLQENTKISDRNACYDQETLNREQLCFQRMRGRGKFVTTLPSGWVWSYSVDLSRTLQCSGNFL